MNTKMKINEAKEIKYTIWVKRNNEDFWRPWGGRTEFPSTKEREELKSWLLDSGYKDMVVTDAGVRPVKDINEDVKAKEKEVEEIPETPTTPDEFGAATIINNLIQDEWQAIQGYNDAVATFSTMGMDDNIINIFKDIANEENIHVGQLQKALEAVSPNADSIKVGEKEGAEQLDVPVEEGAAKEE